MGLRWDPDKDAANRAKHLIGFRQAAESFRSFRLAREDRRRDDGERRFIGLGLYDEAVLRVVYVERDNDIRIISA
ncbi:BrnT family toxin [Methylobacterium sp. E-005]|uniref:BrnT family toxin n=1 Tax=Methylobacterium sp. E-005 TaxID=2836549 RepID=UPI001FB9A21E|nr:BrnT family toxin [Methylobacterium sp. E-005]MCJ2089160.1 BrnT family toxin [Methylobacterium sp. E-005]